MGSIPEFTKKRFGACWHEAGVLCNWIALQDKSAHQ